MPGEGTIVARMRSLFWFVFLVAATADAAAPRDWVSWVPPGYDTVMVSEAKSSSFYRYIANAPAELKLPACSKTLFGDFDKVLMLTQTETGKSANLAHGKIPRDAIEGCIVEYMMALGVAVVPMRDGDVTALTTPRGTTHLAWGKEWLVWHDDRATAIALRKAAEANTSVKSFAKLMPRIDTKLPLWFASQIDYGAILFGVPAVGEIGALTEKPFIRFVFADAKSAERAKREIEKIADDKSRSEAMRGLAKRAAPTVKKDEMTVDLLQIFTAPTALEELQQVVNESKSKGSALKK